MTPITTFIFKYTYEEWLEAIQNWKELQKNGCVGNVLLRRMAEEYMSQFTLPTHQVVSLMKDIIMEIYAELAFRYIDLQSS